MTFNRLANIQYSRLKNKVLTDPLQEPTIPIIATAFQPITEEDYLVLGEFLDTDLLNGEIAINTESDRVWVRSDDTILELSVAGSASSLTGGNGISIGASGSIDLGGTLNQDTIINGNSYSISIGTYGPDEQLSTFSVGANDGISLFNYENNEISSNISLYDNSVFISSGLNGISSITGGQVNITSRDNRSFLIAFDTGLTGTGETFTINGTTFSEGIDFTAQGDPILDAAVIAALDYSGVTDFVSVQYNPGDAYVSFNFSTPATTSTTLTYPIGYLSEDLFTTQVTTTSGNGLFLTSGNTGFIIARSDGFNTFNDATSQLAGIQYGGNYDSTLLENSLVPKRYVDNSISTISLTGGNGISIGASGSIDLGGTLNQNTIINGNSKDFELGVTGSEIDFLRIKALQSQQDYKFNNLGLEVTLNPGIFKTDLDYTSTLGWRSFIEHAPAVISSVVSSNSGYDQTQITQSSTQINILTRTNGGPDTGFGFNSAADSFIFTDNRLTPRGLEYQDDYSANFSVRSLIDKGYLDSVVSGLSFDLINDTTPQLGGNLDLNNFNITGTGSIDIEGNVIADIVQLRGGTGSQGEMSWNTDEETIQLVMDGVTQHIGQDTYIHVRNNTASTILKGTPVRATGTLGASGRITIAPMIADGSVESRFYIGIAAEDITAGTDGQVMSFGKIRQIDLTNFNDGDVLWLDPVIVGGLTNSIPTAPNLKIATAFVIHAASNGTLFVRVENGTDLHNDQRVQISGLTAGNILTYNGTNNRWENSQPIDTNFANTDLTLSGNRSHELNGSTITFTNSATGFLRLNTFNEIFTFGKGDTTNLYFGNNVLRNITTGLQNVIVGNDINGLTTGQVNTFVGFRAGQNINNSGNTFIGGFAGQTLTTGANNIIIGRSAAFLTNSSGAVTNLENSIVIGETARVLNSGDTNTIIIGRNSRGYGSNTAVLGNSDITLTRLRGRVEMNQITSSPTITDNSSFAIWFNTGVPTIRLKDSLGVESNIPLQSTTNAITKTSGVFNRTFTLEAPTATENITIFRTDVAITIQEVIAVSTGTSPSTTYQIKHSTDRSAAGNNLTTSGTTTSTTTGNVATLSVVSVPADSWVWLITTAATGTSVKLTIDIRYTID